MDMKKLIEKMDQFAGQAVGQKPGDQVRGTEKATTKKSGKHPFAGRLVGASESKSLLADLEKELVEGAVKRGLKEEFEAFKEGMTPDSMHLDKASRVKAGDKVVTIAGIHGKIVSVNEEDKTFLIQVDGPTRLKIEKSSINAELSKAVQGVTTA
jgi:preprotein translocase YajC subunit